MLQCIYKAVDVGQERAAQVRVQHRPPMRGTMDNHSYLLWAARLTCGLHHSFLS
jgi:hypothetical protein